MALFGLSACMDDPLTGDALSEQGQSVVTFGAKFRPLENTALGKTRSVKGDAIREIDDIFVAWYLENGTLAGCRYFTRDELTLSDVPRPESLTEGETKHAEFSCEIPFGRYRIYAVANMGDLSDDEAIGTEKTFRAIPLRWNEDDVTKNCQMSGYFTDKASTAYGKGNPEPVTIDRSNVSLHAWIRRAASKVTVSFDAKNLYDNIYIYLKSAQIKDIPLHCSLVDDNKPSSDEELITEGDTICYGTGNDYTNWPRLSCGRGANTYGNHAEDAPSLFFFENMQGLHEKKHIHDNYPRKDSVLYGTYVEVKGYYINRSVENPSYGDITYRCMLGRDMESDFNAERNTHYKLTLVFNKDANNPDWHIDYTYVPQPPEIVVASPMYISYLANQQLTIPLTVYYDKNIAKVTKITADIVGNDWGFYDHPYVGTNTALTNGFLSLDLLDKTSVANRATEYTGSKTYTVPVSQDDKRYRFDIPVYTRPIDLLQGYSGNNYYVGRRRHAKVRFTAWNGDVKLTEKEVEVLQSRRLVNPKGIWRKGSSTKAFRVTLKNSDSSPNVAHKFEALISDGPWTARILDGSDWVRIKDAATPVDADAGWGTGPVEGGTGSKIEFDYKPATTYEDGVRFGRIEITFHNNTCTHVILVSQGFGTVEINGRKWHMTNVERLGVDTANPLLEGSMFKFGNSTDAFLSTNNLKGGYGFDFACYDKAFDVYDASGRIVSKTFKSINADPDNGFTNTGMDTDANTGRKCHIATYDDWQSLTSETQFIRYYGILYGEECDRTLDSDTVTNTYTIEGEERGMRGCFVYDKNTQRHLFFPIGNTGYGRRKHQDLTSNKHQVEGYGVLKYADRSKEMGTVPADNPNPALSLPCLYDLYLNYGCIYLYRQRKSVGGTNYYGFDINYSTFKFQNFTSGVTFPDNNVSGNKKYSGDAAFIRRIDD